MLEANRIGGGTSGISFAWTNAHKKPPRPYHDLNVAGMKAHRALADEFGAAPWWHGGGSLEWTAEADRAAQRDNIEQLQSWGYAAEWITQHQAQELEPDIDPATIGDAPVAFFAASLNRVVRTTVIDARPDGAGRLMLHWNPTDAKLGFDAPLSPSMPEARELVQRARRLLPSIGEVEPEAVRIAIRPIPGDHLSAIGAMPRTSGYYIAITHSGVTMSPFLGQAVADEIVDGRQRAELADFRPTRLFN